MRRNAADLGRAHNAPNRKPTPCLPFCGLGAESACRGRTPACALQPVLRQPAVRATDEGVDAQTRS